MLLIEQCDTRNQHAPFMKTARSQFGIEREGGEIMRKLLQFDFDLHDALVIVGLAMIGCGLWLLKPPIALIVVGSILFWAGTRPPKAVK